MRKQKHLNLELSDTVVNQRMFKARNLLIIKMVVAFKTKIGTYFERNKLLSIQCFMNQRYIENNFHVQC